MSNSGELDTTWSLTDTETQIYCQFLSKFDWEGWGDIISNIYIKYLTSLRKSQERILLPSANILFHFDSVHTELSILININYLRDIRSGNEESAFRIVQDGSLRTARKFNHNVRDQYVLQIRVFDNGTPPLYSDSYGG